MAENRERDTTRGWGGIAGVVVLAAVGLVACYRPNIQNGGYICAEAGKLCPDGFACDPVTNTCRLPGSFSDARPEAPVDAPVADAMSDARSDAMEVACFTPVAGCVSQAATGCDPVCQTRCGCQQKCSVNTAGVVGCNAPLPGSKRAYEACDISASGATTQTDNCAPGLVCVADHCGGSQCYAFCRVDADCPSSTCTGDAGGGVKICAVPFTTCDPIGTQAQRACTIMTQACYVSSTIPDKTICDCPVMAQGLGGTCTNNLDCVAGLGCVDDGTGLHCRLLCTLPRDAGATASSCNSCSTGRSKALGGSTLYGYCY